MMTHLLDTDACIALLRGDSAAVASVSRLIPDEIAVSSITRYELCFGVARCNPLRQSIEAAKVRRLLAQIQELPFERDAADHSARIRAELTALGTPIGPMDLLIAGTALANSLILLTGNHREFERVPGLQLASWQQQ